ncbi:hypothetical protein WA158_005391 [Blastocystis sp. Blastoise]
MIMGNLFGKSEIRVMMFGESSVGKTSILQMLKTGENYDLKPTKGFEIDTIHYKNLNYTIWNMGGSKGDRYLWKGYIPNTDALIFVVDATWNEEEMFISRAYLHSVLESEFSQNIPLLIYVNKSTSSTTYTQESIIQLLDLQRFSLSSTQYHIQFCNSKTGEGLYEGLYWIYPFFRYSFY